MSVSRGRSRSTMTVQEHPPSQEEINNTLLEVFEINLEDFPVQDNRYF